MPQVVPIIAAIVTAVGTGTSIYELTNQPSTPKPSTAPTPLTPTQNAQQTAAVSQQLPNLQSLTGGSLNPEYAAEFGATQAGLNNNPQASGNIQAAINQYFGLTAPGQTGLTPTGNSSGNNGILDLLTRMVPGSSPIPGIAPGGGDEFKGLVA